MSACRIPPRNKMAASKSNPRQPYIRDTDHEAELKSAGSVGRSDRIIELGWWKEGMNQPAGEICAWYERSQGEWEGGEVRWTVT